MAGIEISVFFGWGKILPVKMCANGNVGNAVHSIHWNDLQILFSKHKSEKALVAQLNGKI